jgi:hypothetical protein
MERTKDDFLEAGIKPLSPIDKTNKMKAAKKFFTGTDYDCYFCFQHL